MRGNYNMLLDNHGFDMWSDGYDEEVDISDEDNSFPFAGYKEIMNSIYGDIMSKSPCKILDIGIGTGTLAKKLYDGGNDITGVDFSEEMLKKSKAKMPKANLLQFDITKGLPPELKGAKFDFIVSTYALHHLTDDEKTKFINLLFSHIDKTGTIIIGDISFQNMVDLERCKEQCGDEWDEEFYFVFSEFEKALNSVCKLSYKQISHCGAVIKLQVGDTDT
jgi:putative AdoMet-dependent methyltransferase